MCGIHHRKTKKTVFEFPLSRGPFFYPVTGDGKISIRIRCLPRITCETDFPRDTLTLN
jgi:hypothetical protein